MRADGGFREDGHRGVSRFTTIVGVGVIAFLVCVSLVRGHWYLDFSWNSFGFRNSPVAFPCDWLADIGGACSSFITWGLGDHFGVAWCRVAIATTSITMAGITMVGIP